MDDGLPSHASAGSEFESGPTVVLFAAASTSVVQFRLEFVRELIRWGAAVVVVSPEDAAADRERIESTGAAFRRIDLCRTGMSPFADLRLICDLRKLWRRLPFDHLVCYAHKPAIYGLLTAPANRSRQCWVMLSGLGYAFGGKGYKRCIVRALFRLAYPSLLQRAAGLFLLNSDDVTTLRDAGMLKVSVRTKVLRGEGVPLQLYAETEPTRPHPLRFLMISRLLADKGVREYVRAAEFVKRSHPSTVFSLVGPRDPNPTAVSDCEISDWQRAGIVAYHGTQTDVNPYLRECAVLVLPSYYREGTPRTVLEAMATGRAVITTDAPGCRETIFDAGPPDAAGVRQGRNGFLVPVRSVDALVAAMQRFIDDPELACRMGAEGRRLAEEHYDVHKVNQQILEFMGLARPEYPQG